MKIKFVRNRFDNIHIVSNVLPITVLLAECFLMYKGVNIYCVQDIDGEDHIYVQDVNNKPMFDALISTSRKFVFVWYYIHPSKGFVLMEQMKKIALSQDKDFVIKFPNIPVKTGWPAILRYGKKPAGVALEKFIIKAGNPQLQKEVFSDENLNTYRKYDWIDVPRAMDKILLKAKNMVPIRLGKNIDKIKNIRGYCLYAGCAYSAIYPELGFGMRDIDVQVFFSPEWYTNTRCAFTRHCDIKEFGEPEYFGGKTRWLDLMWNSFHTETGIFAKDVVTYLNEMRHKSDRWATISQRPIIDLNNKAIIYKPKWLKKIEKFMEGKYAK
jgi:hypothetical protein